ncbi:hypothetical protein DRO64_10125 [Candidatus Bathyarchaeota archaeon]|nr:MAG: hypothetical protein DRO64_10125 [Candidatus Bathyarchaeota archaeon]
MIRKDGETLFILALKTLRLIDTASERPRLGLLSIFFGEVQNVKSAGFYSKLLSREMATRLRERIFPYLLLPFRSNEFLMAKIFRLEAYNVE